MKIGIITHHNVINFGAFHQAYALQEAVKRLFPDAEVEIINYINAKQLFYNTVGWFLNYKNRTNIKNLLQVYALPFSLYKARRKYMNLSSLCLTAKSINKLKFDTIIIGSDEVWNYSDAKSFKKIKFGIGLDCANIISYAPSSGNSNTKEIPTTIVEGLKKFRYLSVRDVPTANLVKCALNKVPIEVLDPTFLRPVQYEQNPYLLGKKYILMYYCEHLPTSIKQQIFSYAKNHNLEVLGAGESDVDYERCTVNMSPFQWCEMFRNAEFVFTGTFHGAVFSILNHRQFKVYLTNKARIAKVGALLNNLKIDNRLMDDDFTFDLEKQNHEIDYSSVDKLIEKKKTASLVYLRTAIK